MPRNASGRSGERPDVIPHPGYARDGERAKSRRTGARSLAVAVGLGLALTVHIAGPMLRNGARGVPRLRLARPAGGLGLYPQGRGIDFGALARILVEGDVHLHAMTVLHRLQLQLVGRVLVYPRDIVAALAQRVLIELLVVSGRQCLEFFHQLVGRGAVAVTVLVV